MEKGLAGFEKLTLLNKPDSSGNVFMSVWACRRPIKILKRIAGLQHQWKTDTHFLMINWNGRKYN